MDEEADPQQDDGLTTLLFRLPAELRQQIYHHLVPEVDTLLLPRTSGWFNDFEPQRPDCCDLLWLGTSRAIFLDAAPLIYCAKLIYFHVDAYTTDDRLCLNSGLMSHAQAAYRDDAQWTFDHLRSRLVKKLVLEVHTTTFLEEIPTLLSRFAAYSSQFRHFTALEELYISVRPHYGTRAKVHPRFHYIGDPAEVQQLLRRLQKLDRRERLVNKYASLLSLCRALRNIKRDVPSACIVQWYIPGVEFSKVTYRRSGCPERKLDLKEAMVVDVMDNLWSFISSQSDEQLDEMLLEKPVDLREIPMALRSDE